MKKNVARYRSCVHFDRWRGAGLWFGIGCLVLFIYSFVQSAMFEDQKFDPMLLMDLDLICVVASS